MTGQFDFSRVAKYRIHPGIGLARVGDSRRAFFIGPEVPCDPRAVTPPDGGYKDGEGRVKRQAARFRIYGYDPNDDVVGEIPLLGPNDLDDAGKAKVEWHVHLANKKGAWHEFAGRYETVEDPPLRNAYSVSGRSPDERDPDARAELIIDPGRRSIDGRGHSENPSFDSGRFLGTSVSLGELRADDRGRLLVLGGSGHAASTKFDNPIGADTDRPDFWANNDYWFDDISDGPVTATVTLPDGQTIEISEPEDAAWIIVGPPKFAPGIHSIVTLYDTIREVALDEKWIEDDADVVYYRDIHPILSRTVDTAWVNNSARRGHKIPLTCDHSKEDRTLIFVRLRNPLADAKTAQLQATGKFMPALSGDGGPARNGKPRTWLSLLPSQYRKFAKWRDGDFIPGAAEQISSLDGLSADDQVQALQRAAIEPAVGGGFYPGVEAGHTLAQAKTYACAFRIDSRSNRPGDLTKHLSVPWHAGLHQRKDTWWPTARPDDVVAHDVFEEVDRAWLSGGKAVSQGLEGRVRWDRGLGVSTLLRRPWRNPACAVDDPRDSERRGADDMVRYWSELGFVVPRRTSSGEVIHVETERRPHAGMDIRELFHALLNLEEHRGCLDKAQEYVESVLEAARQVQRLPTAFNFMNNIRPFRYSERLFEARMKDIYDDCVEFAFTEGGRPYNAANENHNPYFRSREQVIERIRQLTPFNFLDGAWLRNIHRLGPMEEVNSILFQIFNEELGDGVLAQNHANVYRDLCHSFGFYPPPVASLAFARDPQFLDSAFESATFQLGIAEFTDRYYPELIGMTLWLEWTALELHRVAAIVERVGLSAHFYRMHIAIDNPEDGHAAGSLRAVKLYLHQVMLQGGEPAVQEQWRRIWDGYVAFALTFAILVQQVIRMVKQQPTLQEQLEQLVERKKTYGQYNHGAKRLAGAPINEWFNDPRGLLRALITEGLIVPGKPDDSPFFELLGFRGPMYHVFSEEEIRLWRRWTLEEAGKLQASDTDEPSMAGDAARLHERMAADPALANLLSGARLERLKRVASARRIGLWLDMADKASNGSGRTNDADGLPAIVAGRKMQMIDARLQEWLGWGMIRTLTHLAAQPSSKLRGNGAASGNGARGEPHTMAERLVLIRDAANPTRPAHGLLRLLKEEFARQGHPAASLDDVRLETTPLAGALDLVVPGNDGRRVRDVLGAWLETGCPLPEIADGKLRPLRFEATLDEEEHHPTGVTLGFGTVH